MAPKEEPDYLLYLVTDSTPAILGEKNLVATVEAAIRGGATIVQYRDKTSDTAHLVRTAKELHQVTKAAKIPLLVNDRVDVALAAGVEGVHVGQDDLDLATARKILGNDSIIGVTVSSEEEALVAARDGADYLGIGTVFATSTKENTKSVIGTAGVHQILFSLANSPYNAIKTVCIGGINASNVQRVAYQSNVFAPSKRLDGVAVVSAIIASSDPKAAATEIVRAMQSLPRFVLNEIPPPSTSQAIIERVPGLIKRVAEMRPLCHNMTNLVVQNFAANVALAIGASPIMSNNGLEAADLAVLGGSLVINMGTTTAEVRSNHLKALAAYNAAGGAVVLDPVGAGATEQRREGVHALMAGGFFNVIKGNENEIQTVAGAVGFQQHGVDSGTSGLSFDEKLALVANTAQREKNIILMTGATDIVSDGIHHFRIDNGHSYLGEITGSGCTLGTTIAAVLAVERENKLLAVLAAMLIFEIAAERAAKRKDVKGPGTFVPAFIDELYNIRQESVEKMGSWAQAARVKRVEVGGSLKSRPHGR